MVIFSVIIPLFNNGHFLSRCINSLYLQGIDESEFEVIIVDDGSTDGGGVLAEQIVKEHTNLCVIHQENHGPGLARNRGLEMAQGQYIHFVDPDDFVLKGAYRYIKDVLLPLYSDFLFFTKVQDAEYGLSFVARPHRIYENSHDRLVQNCSVSSFLAEKLFKHSFLQQYKIQFGPFLYSEDTDFVWNALQYPATLVTTETPIYSYTTNNNGIVCVRDLTHVKRTIESLLQVLLRLKGYYSHLSDCHPFRGCLNYKYRILFNRILCVPLSCKELLPLFQRCASIGIAHIPGNRDIKIYHFLYQHVLFYYLFRPMIRLVYFLRHNNLSDNRDFLSKPLKQTY